MTLSILTITFSGCEKTDYNKLEGSTWEAEANSVVFTLHFSDDFTCTMKTDEKGVHSANPIIYRWRYRSEYDSMWGLFFLQPMDEEGSHLYYSGTVENKKLYLHAYESDIETLCFKKIK